MITHRVIIIIVVFNACFNITYIMYDIEYVVWVYGTKHC